MDDQEKLRNSFEHAVAFVKGIRHAFIEAKLMIGILPSKSENDFINASPDHAAHMKKAHGHDSGPPLN